MEIITHPYDIETTSTQWWFIFNGNNVLKKPSQCSGKISSLYNLVIAETEQECYQYITDNGLVL